MKKTDDCGFSLVELIVVIAIMAVLVAVIAPSLIKYLGKSKKNTDVKNLDEIHNAVMLSIADAAASNPTISVMTGSGVSMSAVYIFKYNGTTAKTTFDSTDSRNSNTVAGFASLVVDHIGNANIGSHVSGQNKIMITINVDSAGVYDVSQSFTN